MEIVDKEIASLKPAEYNPRKLNEKQFEDLRNSLKRFGTVDPAIVNTYPGRENVIIGGHQRLKVAKDLGWRVFPCVEVNLNPEEEKELNIRLNKNTGDWDMSLLAQHFQMDDLVDFGFDTKEVQDIFETYEQSLYGNEEPQEDGYEIPTTIVTRVQPGDIITIGKHRLYCGDATKPESYETLLDGATIQLVLTDPPYNVDYEGGTGLKIQNDKQTDHAFDQFLFDFFTSVKGYMKPGCAIYVWSPGGMTETQFRVQWIKSGLLLKQALAWVKNTFVLGRQDYHWRHETCLYGWKEGAGHYFTIERTHDTVVREDTHDFNKMTKAEMKELLEHLFSDATPTTILRHNKPSRNADHPTMKPLLLLAPMIQNSSQRHWNVCDPFVGSGSTMVVCEQLNRRCYAMELDPKYCDVTIDRMTKAFPGIPVTINGEQI